MSLGWMNCYLFYYAIFFPFFQLHFTAFSAVYAKIPPIGDRKPEPFENTFDHKKSSKL